MVTKNTTLNVLEPYSFVIYFAVLFLSLLLFLSGSSGILLCLFYSYKEWCVQIHEYCSNIVHLNLPYVDYESGMKTTVIDQTDANSDVHVKHSSCDESEVIDERKPSRRNPDNLSARSTQITIMTGEVPQNIHIIEIEPTEFISDTTRSDRQIRSQGPDKELGRISFIIEYYHEKQELHIRDLKGDGLRKKKSQEILNPYITIRIWPDNFWPIKTKVLKNSNTPSWSETIIIERFEYKNLASKAIHFTVQSWRQLKSNDIIGHVIFPLQVIQSSDSTLVFQEQFFKNVQPELQIHRGSIRVLLHYKICPDRDTDELAIHILSAKLIYPPGIIADQCQVLTKISVQHPARSVQHKYSAIHRGSFNPTWNESFTFDMVKDQKIEIHKVSVIIAVREEGFFQDGKLFAYTELGPRHSESNNFHLYTTLRNPDKTIAQWHQLISNIL